MPVRDTRRRYIVFHVLSEQLVHGDEILEAVNESIGMLLGELGLSRLYFKPIFFDEEQGEGILRCDHDDLTDLRAAMSLIDHVGSKNASLIVKGVSGTLRSAKKKFLSHQSLSETLNPETE